MYKVVKISSVNANSTPGQEVDLKKQNGILIVKDDAPALPILNNQVVVTFVVEVDPNKDSRNAVEIKVQETGIKIFEKNFKNLLK